MTQEQHDDTPDEGKTMYMAALAIVKAGLAKGMDFETAGGMIAIEDKTLREVVLDDVLKVIIAEEHFAKNVPLEQVSRKLNLPIERTEKAREEMFEDIEKSAIDSFYTSSGNGTAH